MLDTAVVMRRAIRWVCDEHRIGIDAIDRMPSSV